VASLWIGTGLLCLAFMIAADTALGRWRGRR
jgi:hypothetical protein